MALNKKLTTFVSNWLGVIIATIIVIISATFGGMYLYGRSRIDSAINFATQAITLRPVDGWTRSGPADAPPPYVYDIVFQLFNPYADTINISISDVIVTLDTYALPVVKVGSWEASMPTGYKYFEGNITIDEQTFSALAAKQSVNVDIKGNISGSGQYKWIKRQSQIVFDIHLPGTIFTVVSA